MTATQTTQPAAAKRRSLLGPLWLQVMLGIALGIVIGFFFRTLPSS